MTNMNIVDLADERRTRKRPLGCYFVRVDLYEDGIAGEVLDMPGDFGCDEQRVVANHLATLSRYMRDLVYERFGDDEDKQLSEVRVFKSGRVFVWTSNDCETSEQLEWLDRRFDDAKEAARPEDGERA